jgi:hypothetical protein
MNSLQLNHAAIVELANQQMPVTVNRDRRLLKNFFEGDVHF